MDRPQLFSVVTFTLPWRERLRVLFGREVRVRVETTTDVQVSTAEGRSDVSVAPLFPPRAPKKGAATLRSVRRDPSIYQEGDEADPRFLDFSRRGRSSLYLRRG